MHTLMSLFFYSWGALGVISLLVVGVVKLIRQDRAARAAEAESRPERVAAAKHRRQMVANWFRGRRAQLPG